MVAYVVDATSGLANATNQLQAQVASLDEAHGNLARFNSAFGNFLDGLDVYASTLTFAPLPAKRPVQVKVPAPEGQPDLG